MFDFASFFDSIIQSFKFQTSFSREKRGGDFTTLPKLLKSSSNNPSQANKLRKSTRQRRKPRFETCSEKISIIMAKENKNLLNSLSVSPSFHCLLLPISFIYSTNQLKLIPYISDKFDEYNISFCSRLCLLLYPFILINALLVNIFDRVKMLPFAKNDQIM